MPSYNATNFQIFLDEFSSQNPTEFKIIVLDNGAFTHDFYYFFCIRECYAIHKATSLIIPENIAFIFLPPYSPELNAAENVWAILKRKFTNKLHHSLEEVSDFIKNAIEN